MNEPRPQSRGDVLSELAAGVEDAAGFQTVVVNLYRAGTDDYEALVVKGDDEVRQALHETTMPRDVWMKLLEPRFERFGTYLIPEGDGTWDDDMTIHEPERDASDGPDRWRKGDALIVPIRTVRGAILGLISVDDPTTGKQPTDWQLFKLTALAAQAGVRLDGATDD